MIVTFKDLQTGETAKKPFPFSIWWWSEGNGSCNCNRESLFGRDGSSCHPLRYVAVDVEDHPDKTIEQALAEANKDVYEEYHFKTKEDILRAINEGFYFKVTENELKWVI